MRPIGFSTGALAYADFRLGVTMALSSNTDSIELSALREAELSPLLDGLKTLELDRFSYISIHAPSQMSPNFERSAAERLLRELDRGWPLVVHPDALRDFDIWAEFGPQLCVENMDKRKPVGRTADELRAIFEKLPQASLCFDIGHARQVNPTMTEAYLILREFGDRLRQVHVSEVSTSSRHSRLSYGSILAFQEVAHWIPQNVPLILETPVQVAEMEIEIARAREALPLGRETLVA